MSSTKIHQGCLAVLPALRLALKLLPTLSQLFRLHVLTRGQFVAAATGSVLADEALLNSMHNMKCRKSAT